jgi:hypothetical protein
MELLQVALERAITLVEAGEAILHTVTGAQVDKVDLAL